tara:strand:+ start:553 stop:849 length:297 start_codon:yes stop_codon:yes gene_type:complete
MKENQHKNYMWRVYPKHPEYSEYYRFQTTDPYISKKLSKMNKSKLVSNALNAYHKIYELSFKSPKKALSVFKRLVGQKLKKSGERGLFYAETPRISTL